MIPLLPVKAVAALLLAAGVASAQVQEKRVRRPRPSPAPRPAPVQRIKKPVRHSLPPMSRPRPSPAPRPGPFPPALRPPAMPVLPPPPPLTLAFPPLSQPRSTGISRPPRSSAPSSDGGYLTFNDNAPRSRPLANPLHTGRGAINPPRPAVGQGDGRFGAPRSGGRTHRGIDLTAPVGTRVYPVAPGRVIFSGPGRRREGNEVVIGHPDGTTSVYLHLNGQQMPTRTGVRVTPHNVIGQVGRSGNVPPGAASHLHLGVYQGKTPVVPNLR